MKAVKACEGMANTTSYEALGDRHVLVRLAGNASRRALDIVLREGARQRQGHRAETGHIQEVKLTLLQ